MLPSELRTVCVSLMSNNPSDDVAAVCRAAMRGLPSPVNGRGKTCGSCHFKMYNRCKKCPECHVLYPRSEPRRAAVILRPGCCCFCKEVAIVPYTMLCGCMYCTECLTEWGKTKSQCCQCRNVQIPNEFREGSI